MKYSYNMPYQKEMESGGGGAINSSKFYKPLPDKAGLKVYNEVFIPLCSPTKWKMFNPTPEHSQKYGIVGGSSRANSLVSIPPDLATFYFKLPMHKVSNYNRPDGTVGFSYIICPIKMNEYLVKYLGFGPMFENPRCADCEKEQEWWDSHNNRWSELGYTEDSKKGLSTDDYRKIVDGDQILKRTRSTARDYQASDRYILNIFDHDKFTGNRAMDEDQTSLEYQIWMAPKSIFDGLIDVYKVSKDNVDQGLDVPFFDTSSPNGLHILSIMKNTTECVGNNLQKTKYGVISGRKYAYPPEWIEYLNNFDAMVDPSDFVFMPNYVDRKASLDGEDSNVGSSAGAVVNRPFIRSNMPQDMSHEPRASVPTPPANTPSQQHQMVNNTPNQYVSPPISNMGSPPIPPNFNATNRPPVPPEPPITRAPSGMPPIVTPDRTPPGGSPPPAKKRSW